MHSGFANLLEDIENAARILVGDAEEEARKRRLRLLGRAQAMVQPLPDERRARKDGVVAQPSVGPRFVKTGAAAHSIMPGALGEGSATVGAILAPGAGLANPSAVYAGGLSIASLFEDDEPMWRSRGAATSILNEEERRRQGRGGGGGATGIHDRAARGRRQAATVANLAARAAGAQPTVIKVISTVHSRASAANLINYLGTRETEAGERASIPILDQDGVGITTAQERSAVLAEWTARFRENHMVAPIVSLSFTVPAGTDDVSLHSALNETFGERPFVYAMSGQRCDVFGISDLSSTRLGVALAARAGKAKGGTADYAAKAEAAIGAILAGQGIDAPVTITGATAKTKSAKYFLEKFVRDHREWTTSSGDKTKTGAFAKAHTRRLWSVWEGRVRWENPRNAFHVVFSARAGTKPEAMVRAVRDFLTEQLPGHKWLTAHHPETGHVHVHAMIAARSALGKPLRFSKPQLAEWRELFASKAREHGIDMVATRRADVAASRPFTQGQVGAYERSKRNPRYTVDPRVGQRVEKKRAGVLEPAVITVGNAALNAAWLKAKTILEVTAADQRIVLAAEKLATLPGSAGSPPTTAPLSGSQYTKSVEVVMKEVFAMALSPAEFERKVQKINSNLDEVARAAKSPELRAKVEQTRLRLAADLDERRRELSANAGGTTTSGRKNVRDTLDRERKPDTYAHDSLNRSQEAMKQARLKSEAKGRAASEVKATETQKRDAKQAAERSKTRDRDNDLEM